MARPLRTLSTVHITSISAAANVLFFVAAVFAIVSMVSFLCTSRKLRPRTQRHHEDGPSDRKYVLTIRDISSKTHLMAKMLSWRKEDESDEAVWRKTILMGDRRRPLDFSGRILYDLEGNKLLEPPKQMLKPIALKPRGISERHNMTIYKDPPGQYLNSKHPDLLAAIASAPRS